MNALEYSADGQRLAAGVLDGHLRILQAADGRLLEDITAPGAISSLAFADDQKTIIYGAGNNAFFCRTRRAALQRSW